MVVVNSTVYIVASLISFIMPTSQSSVLLLWCWQVILLLLLQKEKFPFLKEVVASATAVARGMALVVGDGGEDAELGAMVTVNSHDGGHVAAAVAVVGGGPDSDDGFFGKMILSEISREGLVNAEREVGIHLVSFIHQLVSTSDGG